jgi:hypothetical protein
MTGSMLVSRRMSRPIRIEFAGALYHVTSHGDRREAIYEVDGDRVRFLDVLGEVVSDFNWVVHAYCLMTNHYHLLVETPDANLSRGMRQLGNPPAAKGSGSFVASAPQTEICENGVIQ